MAATPAVKEAMPLLLDPEILEAGRGLSPAICAAGVLIGAYLYLWGGRTHRFWLALLITVVAGWIGLTIGPEYGMQPLVAGLLLAVSAGVLALSLMRIVLFVAGGLALLGVMRWVAPGWEPIACFLAGGLVGVLFYRFWITVLASFSGTMMMGYSALWLLDLVKNFDAIQWTTTNGPLLNWGCIGLAVMGVLTQYLLERRQQGGQAPASAPPPEEKEPEEVEEVEEKKPEKKSPPKASPPPKGWWARLKPWIFPWTR